MCVDDIRKCVNSTNLYPVDEDTPKTKIERLMEQADELLRLINA